MKREIIIDIDSTFGNRLYWFLKELMKTYPEVIREKSEATE